MAALCSFCVRHTCKLKWTQQARSVQGTGRQAGETAAVGCDEQVTVFCNLVLLQCVFL